MFVTLYGAGLLLGAGLQAANKVGTDAPAELGGEAGVDPAEAQAPPATESDKTDEAALIPTDSDAEAAPAKPRMLFVSATAAPQLRWLRSDLAVPLPGSPRSGTNLLSRVYADARLNSQLARSVTLNASARTNWIEPLKGRYDDRSLRLDLREAFLAWSVNSAFIVEAGRINVRSGVALGYNPTDFFRGRTVVDPVTVDPSVLRLNRLGTAMVRFTGLNGPLAVAVSAAPNLARREPVVLTERSFANLRLGRTNSRAAVEVRAALDLAGGTSVQLSGFAQEGRGSALGFNFVSGLGDKATVFLEAAAGRSADVFSEALAEGVRERELPAPAAQAFARTSDRIRPRAALGATYTTSGRVTITAEIDYSAAGLSHRQWRERVQTAAGGNALVRGAFWYARSLVGQQQELISRQQAFVRVAWDEAFGLKPLSLSSLALTPVVDGSALLQATADYKLSDRWSVGGLVQAALGSRRSIYGSSPQSGGIQLHATCFF